MTKERNRSDRARSPPDSPRSGSSHILLLIGVFLFGCGVYLFLHGFVLNRVEVLERSSCTDGINSCRDKPPFRRVLIVVIDALRYDFLIHQESPSATYHNRFQSVIGAMREQPESAVALRFIADPPTTTMQRIKGLTTGGLPTFIDISKNFASVSIAEDNVLAQAVHLRGMNATFIGDDTWVGLFPTIFKRQYAFPSFDVNDLHTVDDGVIRHLSPERTKADWQIIIAHFLGVDHCGHRYSPAHPEMVSKLLQMDSVLRDLMATIDDDTLLVVFGDHGMTSTGDHGGDSDDEVNAGLFVYARKPSFHVSTNRDAVHQVDLVPTLSILLGLPIPFSNVGSVIPSLLPRSLRETALLVNTKQLHRFLRVYEGLSGHAFPSWYFKQEQGEGSMLNHLRRVRESLTSIWARFDEISMIAGISVMLVASGILLALSSPRIIWRSLPTTLLGLTPFIALCALQFSNSYVVYEDAAVLFLLQLYILACAWQRGQLKSPILFVNLLLIRSGALFRRCREEQRVPENVRLAVNRTGCIDSRFTLPMELYATQEWAGGAGRAVLAIACLYVLATLAHRLLSQYQIRWQIVSAIGFLLLTLYWSLDFYLDIFSSSANGQLRYYRLWLPRALFALWMPLLVSTAYSLMRRGSSGAKHGLAWFVAVVQLQLLVHGDGYSLSLLACVVVLLTNRLDAIGMQLLACHTFYSTGHQATFVTLHLSAAYHGIAGTFEYSLIPGILLTVETLGAWILIGTSLAVRCVAYFSSNPAIHFLDYKCVNRNRCGSRTEIGLQTSDASYSNVTLAIMCTGLAVVKVLLSMIATLLLRRHLMMWKIFAPRFLFEASSCIALCAIVWLSILARPFVEALRNSGRRILASEFNVVSRRLGAS